MDVASVTVTEGWIGRELCRQTWLVSHNGSLRSGIPSDCRREPSPSGRGGKMLEETLLDYSFISLVLENNVPCPSPSLLYRTGQCAF
jgi:hypothetical protein